ncbi:MAG: hypothetical protein DRJ52_10310 [Thermoprotei archaeon]|nr:MAG: hypothetical protein DRJ52_10310 [Thermoprotei archaeon]
MTNIISLSKRKRLRKAARMLIKDKIPFEVLSEIGISNDELWLLFDAIDYLKEKFPNKSASWYERSVYRFITKSVRKVGKNKWIVRGLRELDDYYDSYTVIFNEHKKKYYCDCFYTLYGQVRQRRVCSHIGSVIIYNQYEKQLKVIKE